VKKYWALEKINKGVNYREDIERNGNKEIGKKM
jgi:hypothetical protein